VLTPRKKPDVVGPEKQYAVAENEPRLAPILVAFTKPVVFTSFLPVAVSVAVFALVFAAGTAVLVLVPVTGFALATIVSGVLAGSMTILSSIFVCRSDPLASVDSVRVCA